MGFNNCNVRLGVFLLSMDEGNGTLGLRQRGFLCVKHSKKTITVPFAINVMVSCCCCEKSVVPGQEKIAI